MLEILNGRDKFYQWDVNQKLVVDDNIIAVQYDNGTGDALVCGVYELDGVKVADVPNIMLQTYWAIKAYAYCGECVRAERVIEVEKRSRPDDYVYTETETLRYTTLFDMLNDTNDNVAALESKVDEEVAALDDKVEANTAAIESIETELDSNYYTKEEVNTAIENVEVDLSNYYTKEEVNTALGEVEVDVDLTDYYTKAEVDKAIAENGGNGGGSGCECATPDWNAQEGEAGYIANRTHGEMPGLVEILPEITMTAESEGYITTPLNGSLTVGETAIVNYNGTDYESEVFEYTEDTGDGIISMKVCGNPMLMGIGEDNGIPFMFAQAPAEYAAMSVYAMFMPIDMFESGAANISVKVKGIIIKKLDSKYIPSSNWSAAEGEAGHIENRTHYTLNNPSFSITGDATGKDSFVWDKMNGLLLYKINDADLTKENLENTTLDFYSPEISEEGNSLEYIAGEGYYYATIASYICIMYVNNAELTNSKLNLEIPSNGLYVGTIPGVSGVLHFNDEVVKKVDNKYLNIDENKKYTFWDTMEITSEAAGMTRTNIRENEFKHLIIKAYIPQSSTETDIKIQLGTNNNTFDDRFRLDVGGVNNTEAAAEFIYYCDTKYGYLDAVCYINGKAIKPKNNYILRDIPPITEIGIHRIKQGVMIPIGSTFEVWGAK